MSKPTLVPITGAVLSWAVDESGYSRSEFVEKFKAPVDAALVQSWIDETEKPTKTQFNRIVEVLKRPSAMFFLAAPPDASLPPNFRHAPGPKPRDVTPSERVSIRWALQLQDSLRTTLLDSNAAKISLPAVPAEEKPSDAAVAVRAFLGVDVAQQRSWKNRDDAFKKWRETFEQLGLVALNLELGNNALRGFSNPDEYAPLVAVNTWYNTAARSYTLAHELGHLVAGTESSCWGFAGPGAVGKAGSERWCELFAAELLLPRDAVREYMTANGQQATGTLVDVSAAEKLASAFHVSVRAAALRLINLSYSPNTLYDAVDEQFVVFDQKKPTKGGGGRDRTQIRVSEIGAHNLERFIDGIHSGALEKHDTLNVLRVHPDELPALERRVVEAAS